MRTGAESDYAGPVKRRCRRTPSSHMPQDLFFAIAAQVDWRWAARRFIVKLAAEEGFHTGGVDAGTAEVYQAIADGNDIDVSFLATRLNKPIQDHVYFDKNMAKDFRIAMSHLCVLERSPERAVSRTTDRRTGSPATTRACRTSSRSPSTLPSPGPRRVTCCVLPSTGSARLAARGRCCCIDNARVTERHRSDDGSRYYTRAMTIDQNTSNTLDGLRVRVQSTASIGWIGRVYRASDRWPPFLDQEAASQSRW